MVRTQIQLTEIQARGLRERAQDRGISLAEVIRGYVEQGLAADAPARARLYARANKAIGRWRDRSGVDDLADQHDRYLAEAYR